MAKITTPRVYLDSCIFLNVIKHELDFWAESLKILLAADRGDIRLVASTLVLIEVAGWNGEVAINGRDKMIDQYLRDSIEWHEVDLFVAREAQKYCDNKMRMRGPDATHLATAVRAKVDYLMTWDQQFPIGKQFGSVQVIKPTVVWQPTFEDVQVDNQLEEETKKLKEAEAVAVPKKLAGPRPPGKKRAPAG